MDEHLKWQLLIAYRALIGLGPIANVSFKAGAYWVQVAMQNGRTHVWVYDADNTVNIPLTKESMKVLVMGDDPRIHQP